MELAASIGHEHHVQPEPIPPRRTMTNDATDWPLVIDGDDDAFARIFDRHAELVYKFARRRLGDPTAAEDIVSQVFLETWRKRDVITLLDGSLRAWLIGLARNLQRRHWRLHERHGRAIGRLDPVSDQTDPSDTIIERLDAIDDLADVRRRLETLSADHSEVLQLSVWEELSYEEIATVLDVAVGTVRSRLSRARQKLALDGTRPPDRASTGSSSSSSAHDPESTRIERTPR